jgi:hypothetical protein
VNAIWIFSFFGFIWWYSDPSMYITQSVIQKDFEKPGFECAPLGYDEHYEISVGYAECELKILEPNTDTVTLSDDGEYYEFIPFPTSGDNVVLTSERTAVTKGLYDPVGGGTGAAAQATDPFFDFIFGGGYDDHYGDGHTYEEGEDDPEYEGLVELSGCNCKMVWDGGADDEETSQLRIATSNLYIDDAAEQAKCSSSPPASPGGDPHGGSGAPPDDGGGYDPNMVGSDPNMGGGTPDPHGRKLLTGHECTLDQAKAIAMFKKYMEVNDPCNFVKRNTPFQCVKEAPLPVTQVLSLANANSGLFYSVVSAVMVGYMYATKKVTLEQVDLEAVVSASRKIAAEETPAK